MLWLLAVACLSTSASGFPFHTIGDRNKVGNFLVQPTEYAGLPQPKPSLCLHSPFLGQICLPSPFHFFKPLQSLNAGPQRSLSIPLTTAYIVKFCPTSETTFGERNLSETSKEIIKEVETEAEKERLSDNINIEVNGEEVEPENFVKKENGVETKESKVDDKNVETKNKIIRLSEEIMEVSGDENHSPEKMLLYKNFQDEGISISSNLV